MSNSLSFLARLFPGVRQMQRDAVRIRSEREEWRQRYASLKARTDLETPGRPLTYHRDGMATIHNADFLQDKRFRRAYEAGTAVVGADFQREWRVRVGLWAAEQARYLPGDFVECGPGEGVLSRAVMEYLDWSQVPKTFHVLGPPAVEARAAATAGNGNAAAGTQAIHELMSPFPNVHTFRASIEDGLSRLGSIRIAWLTIDLDTPEQEIAAGEHLWPRVVPGGVLLLDDFSTAGHEAQMHAWEEFAARHGTPVLGLPTGQGLLVKRC